MVTRRRAAALIGMAIAVIALLAIAGRSGARAVDRLPRLGTPGAPSTTREGLGRTIEAMESRLQRDASDSAAAVTLAEALWRQSRIVSNGGLLVRAEEIVRDLLAREPMDVDARRMLATVLASQHRFGEALTESQRAAVQRPTDSWSYGVMADAHLELGNYNEGYAAIDRMLQLKPDAAAYARASYARELRGDLAGAISLMRMAVEATSAHDPEAHAWYLAQLGALHLEAGDLAAARRFFTHADAVFTDHPAARLGLVRVTFESGDAQATLAKGAPLFDAAPSPDLAALLGRAARALGQHDAARRYDALAEQMWQFDQPDAAALARFMADRGGAATAAVAAAERARATRQDIFTEDALAWALFKAGRIPEARAASRRALRTGSRDRVLRRHADEIERAFARLTP